MQHLLRTPQCFHVLIARQLQKQIGTLKTLIFRVWSKSQGHEIHAASRVFFLHQQTNPLSREIFILPSSGSARPLRVPGTPRSGKPAMNPADRQGDGQTLCLTALPTLSAGATGAAGRTKRAVAAHR